MTTEPASGVRRFLRTRINWPLVIAFSGLVLAAGMSNLLAALLWVGGGVFGYGLALHDGHRPTAQSDDLR